MFLDYLNTEKACGPIKNVEAYASSLLYNYLEHNGLFNQYVTYEQKGIELLRGNYKSTTNHEFYSLSGQLIEDIAPFLLDKYTEHDLKTMTQEGNTSGASVINNAGLVLEALDFLKKNLNI